MCALQIVYFKDGGQGSEGESLDDDVNVEALADVGQCTGSGVRDAPTNKEHVNNYDQVDEIILEIKSVYTNQETVIGLNKTCVG